MKENGFEPGRKIYFIIKTKDLLAVNSHAICLIFATSFFALVVSFWGADPDLFMHLKLGEWIVHNGAVPKTDMHSWTAYGFSWTDHSWLWQALMYLLFKGLGYPGLWVMPYLSVFGAGIMVYAGLKKRGVSPNLAAVIGAALPLLLLGHLKPWAQSGVYLLFGAYIFLSLRGVWTWREIFYTAGIGLVCSNIHAAGVMFPLLIAAEAAWLKIFLKRNAGCCLAAALSAGMATLLTPFGIDLWKLALDGGLPYQVYSRFISEYSPYYANFIGFPYNLLAWWNILVSLLMLSIFVTAIKKGKWITLEFARAAGFWVLTITASIYVPYAIISTLAIIRDKNINCRDGILKRLTGVILVIFGTFFIFAVWFFDLYYGLGYHGIVLTVPVGVMMVLFALVIFLRNESKPLSVVFWCSSAFLLTCWLILSFKYGYFLSTITGIALILMIMVFGLRKRGNKRLSALVIVFCLIHLLVVGIPDGLDQVARKNGYPVDAVRYCDDRRVFNYIGYGGYLIWYNIPVFIDGRLPLFRQKDEHFAEKYYALCYHNDLCEIEAGLSETRAEAVLFPVREKLAKTLRHSSKWKVVFEDENNVVFQIIERPE